MDKDLLRCLDLLMDNEEEVRNDAENALLTVCQNILSHPDDKQYREVRLDNPTIVEKLLPASGAMECLFDVGFIEAADCLVLPQETSLSKLQALQSSLSRNSSIQTSIVNNIVNSDLLPKNCTPKEKKFFIKIIQHFQNIMRYEDLDLQEKAKKLIPIRELEVATMLRARELQRRIKLNETNSDENIRKQLNESDFDTKDLFLMELLHWFKYKFFTWVDSPRCSACFGSSEYRYVVRSQDPKCPRIEIYRCTNCEALIKFPRYSDPEPLLTLRRGRCGEWATVFTLFCRSLDYDARLADDYTDHIWTEVWSVHEKRWIHVDPCEDVMDRPLMYEKGWKKKLTYIIAYSKDEVQDVTWRYTRDQLGVMRRRNICSESKLLEFIESLNRRHQCSSNYSASRRQYVIKRRLLELVELICMPEKQNSGNNEGYQERSTGSYEWKLARGEVSQADSKVNYTWDISKYGETFQLHYSIIKDVYKVLNNDGKILLEVVGWQNGTNDVEGQIFRKIENDWKMVYLARSPGTSSGQIKWIFIVTDPNLFVSTFQLQAVATVFHGANVFWQIEAFFDDKEQNKPLVFPIDDCTHYHTDQLNGSTKLILTAIVSGGQGDTAWQHAQLFRQNIESEEDRSLIIDIQLKNR